MSKLISREHDKFSGITKTTTKEFSWGGAEFSLHHVSNIDGESLSLNVHCSHNGPDFNDQDLNLYMYLDFGELILNINHTKNIVLKPIDAQRTRRLFRCIDIYHYIYEEIASYSLTKEQLQMLCSAESIEYKLTGNGSPIVCEEQPERKDDNLGMTYFPNIAIWLNFPFQLYAKALYNAIYDQSAYIQELKAADRKVSQKEAEAQAEAQAEEKEAISQAKTQKQINIIWIIVLLMSIALLVISIVESSGKLFWIGIAGVVVSIAVLAFSN